MPYSCYSRIVLSLLLSLACAACGGGGAPSPGASGSGSPEPGVRDSSLLIQSSDTSDAGMLLQYDDGRLTQRFPLTTQGVQRLGVWFTPTGPRPCALRGVHYAFAADPDTDTIAGPSSHVATGLVYSTIPGGGPMKMLGPLLDSFSVDIPARGGVVNVDLSRRNLMAREGSDLFIAIESSDRRMLLNRFILGDTLAGSTPLRSYAAMSGTRLQPAGVTSLASDLGIRAVFSCDVQPPPARADSLYTIRLQWDKRPADLDLYLIRNARDTIYWGRKRLDTDRRLDVDVIRDFGPEMITYLVDPRRADSLHVAVYYHAPSQGPATQAVVTTSTNGTVVRRDTCVIKPSTWWNVETRGPGTGAGWFGSRCNTVLDKDRAARKMGVGGG